MTAARLRRTGALEWGVAVRALAGASACGDLEVVHAFPGGVLVGVVDGLGHGHEAAQAARLARGTLVSHAGEPLPALLRRCHDALVESRGVVMSVAAVAGGALRWLGVGNVTGLVLRAAEPASRQTLLARGGVVGLQLPPLFVDVVPFEPGDTLVFATDGVRPDFADRLARGARPQELAEHVLERHMKGNDDALVLVARLQGDGR